MINLRKTMCPRFRMQSVKDGAELFGLPAGIGSAVGRMAISACLAMTCLATAVSAGQFNTVMDIGSKAPAWTDLPGTDGEKHSSDSVADHSVVVVAFTCNSCPYAVDVEDRLIALSKRYRGKSVAIVAINVNKVDEDRLPAMTARAKEKGFEFPYLWDETQEIAKDYGAKFTPEFFVMGKDGKVAYMGAFDDSPAGDGVTKTYVADAVDAVLAGNSAEIAETPPIGCLIRFERQRRTRKP